MLRLAYVRFTSCSGCQLTLLNAEEALPLLATLVELVRFPMATSRADDGGPLDVALVEGSVSRPEELQELLELRRRARLLVAVGACAISGGVNRIEVVRRWGNPGVVYGDAAQEKRAFLPQPLHALVRIDFSLAGCPPAAEELLQLLETLSRGGLPALPEQALCLECRWRENRCLLIEGRLPCLGPVTRLGCGVHCPSRGIPCEGCRGPSAEANWDEMRRQLHEIGLGPREIRARLNRFTGDADNGNAAH